MSRMRRRFGTIPWLGTACLLLFAAVLIHSGAPQAMADRPVYSFTGEQLYRGLLFGDGPVAEVIPQVRDHYRVTNFVTTVEELQLVRATQDRIISAIDETAPEFFRDFRSMIRSGDHFMVQKALREAADVTLRAIGSIPEVKELRARFAEDPSLRDQMLADLRSTDPEYQHTDEEFATAADILLAGTFAEEDHLASIVAVFVAAAALVVTITVVLALSYATAINIAGAVNFYAALVATTAVTAGLTDAGTTSLLMEEMVQSITVQLAA